MMSLTPSPDATTPSAVPSPQRRRPRAGWTAVVCGMASYIDAAVLMSWTTVLVLYQHAFGLTPLDVGIISGALTFGVAVGALIGGRLGDAVGRRVVFIVTMVVILLGVAGMMITSDVTIMVICAAAVGLAVGADMPVSLSTIAETANDRSRGWLLGLSQLFWGAGALVPSVLGVAVGDLGRTGALIILGSIAVAAVLVLLGRFTIPESSSWLTARAERRAGVPTVRADRASVLDLLRQPYVVPFVALLVFYGLGNATSTVLGSYSTYLLVNVAGVSVSQASVVGIIVLPTSIAATLIFLKTVGGKRRFLYFKIGAVMVAVSTLLPLVLGVSFLSFVVAIIILSFFACFAGEALMKVWTQQSFPTLLRSTAQGTVIAAGRTVSALFAVAVPVLASTNVAVLFLLIFIFSIISGGVAWFVFRKWDAHNEFDTEASADPVAGEAVSPS